MSMFSIYTAIVTPLFILLLSSCSIYRSPDRNEFEENYTQIKLQNLKLSTESLTDEQYLQAIIEVDKAQAALRVIS